MLSKLLKLIFTRPYIYFIYNNRLYKFLPITLSTLNSEQYYMYLLYFKLILYAYFFIVQRNDLDFRSMRCIKSLLILVFIAVLESDRVPVELPQWFTRHAVQRLNLSRHSHVWSVMFMPSSPLQCLSLTECRWSCLSGSHAMLCSDSTSLATATCGRTQTMSHVTRHIRRTSRLHAS